MTIRTLILGLFVMLLTATVASALTIETRPTFDGSLYTGEYMFTVTDPSNDTAANMAGVEAAAEAWFLSEHSIVVDLMFASYDKVDAPDTSSAGANMTVKYITDTNGTWSTVDPIEFYTVKASTEFALYWIDGGASEGLWSTQHLVNNGGQQPEISHLSTWNEVAPVPEPATFILLGGGLIGLAVYRRKRH